MWMTWKKGGTILDYMWKRVVEKRYGVDSKTCVDKVEEGNRLLILRVIRGKST